MRMNPYRAPNLPPAPSSGRFPIGSLILAALLTAVACIIAAPGMILQTLRMPRPGTSGRRYATYDPELYLFGIPISETAATWLTFAVAPALLLIAVGLLIRAWQSRSAQTSR